MVLPIRHAARLALLALTGCAAQALPQQQPLSPGLLQAAQNYPPIIMGSNVHPADGAIPLSCPASGARVEQSGGPTLEFLGASVSNPDLCHMRIGGQAMDLWYGIWGASWAGGVESYPALKQIIHGSTGDVSGFDTYARGGLRWHDLVRNEGIEDISLLGKTYHALKLSHYREGFDNNPYRSLSTVWKDIPTGLTIYGTYQHIAGAPQLDGALTPAAIIPAP
jgi:hypothetical protein